MTWTFHLKEGVKFHDGSEVDSKAVKFSFTRSQTGSASGYTWKPVESIETPDKYTVQLSLKYPAAMDLVTAASYGAYITSPTAFETYGDKVFEAGYDAGSGPYTLKSASLTEVLLERFPDYWGGWADTHARAPDAAVIRQMAEPAVRSENLEQDAAQVIQSAAVTDLPRLLEDPSLKLHNNPGWVALVLIFNTKKEPLTDIHLREALWYAYPYQQAIDLAYGGYAEIPAGTILPGIDGYTQQNERFTAPAQDMEKARAALAQSKYPDGGVTLKCHVVAGDDKAAKCCELFKAALSELNITLNIQAVSTSVIYTQAVEPNPKQDILCTQWTPSYGSAKDVAENMFRSQDPNAWNLSYWTSPETDKLFDEAILLEASQRDASIEKILEAWAIIEPQKTTIFAGNLQSTPVARTSLKGFEGFAPSKLATVLFYDTWFE
jgi:peptide/nickel transport system substrate-binding protein